MPIFKSDTTWRLFARAPLLYVAIGFLAGYFLNNAAAFAVSGILMILLILAWLDCEGRELDRLINYTAITNFCIGLVVLWVTLISINHWWTYIVPVSILR